MRLLVDGVFFQLAQTGIARVWKSLLCRLAIRQDLDVFLLDRGGAPQIDGIELIPFPTYTHTANAADSTLIQKMCDQYKIDVFASTYYTTPLITPSILMVYDMIPEILRFDTSHRIWNEKALAISHAQRIVCISENTNRDLHSLYPSLQDTVSVVAHCGFDQSFFYPSRTDTAPSMWSRVHTKPYFLLVGSREQHNGYKNCKLFFQALAESGCSDIDVVCAGGESVLQPDFLELVPKGCEISRHDFSDAELGEAYRNALALVYPSLYEGFGMPVLEAMASGCPVITTSHGSLSEVTGDAAITISGYSIEEMVSALQIVQNPEQRTHLAAKGLMQASKFSWDKFTEIFVNQCVSSFAAGEYSASRAFYHEWRRLRLIQGSVDVNVYVSM